MSNFANNPSYWQMRAEQARRIAGETADLAAKQALDDIAADYARLAARAKERLAEER